MHPNHTHRHLASGYAASGQPAHVARILAEADLRQAQERAVIRADLAAAGLGVSAPKAAVVQSPNQLWV